MNASGYSNSRVDELIEKIDREMVTYGRDAMIEEVWKIVLGDIVHIPLHHQGIAWAMRNNLEIPIYPSTSRFSARRGSRRSAGRAGLGAQRSL
jgi:peptide/nickel transport system substrate-binding protein